MIRFVQKILAKPPHVRERYAFFTALGFTSVVALFWFSANSANYFQSTTQPNPTVTKESGAFSSFINQAKEQVANVINSTKEEVSEAMATSSQNVINLSPEEIEELRLQMESSQTAQEQVATSSANTNSTTEVDFEEVMIATTTSSTTPL
jgi:hypothetical protein